MEDSSEGPGEEGMKEGGTTDEVEINLKKMRPPNRKKFEEEMEALMKTIKEKESEIKPVGGKPDDLSRSQSITNLKALKAERDSTIEQRRKLDIALKALNTEITKSTRTLSGLQSNLHYKSEDKIEEAIRRLEYQLKNQNFRLSEEKKIVNEIDSLKRSKKFLSQYLTQKKEVDELRANQRKMREDREHLYKTVSNLKSQEDELRKKTSVNKSKNDSVKKELDVLYERKRHIVLEFKRYEKEYYGLREEVRKKQRQESLKKREEEKRAQVEAYEKEMAEYESQKEPYEDEKLLCNTLITYLQRFLTTDTDPANTEEAAASSTGQPVPAISHQDGMYVLLKKPEVELFGGITRKGKKGSKKKKISMHKPVTHTPQIFAQFSSLSLSAPSNLAEVPVIIEKIQDKKKFFDSFVKHPGFYEDQSLSSLSVSVSDYGADSLGESLLSESGVSGTWSLQSNEATSTEEADEDHSASGNFTTDICRQTSKTESTGSTSENQTCDSIVDALASIGARCESSVQVTASPGVDDSENSAPECDMGCKSLTTVSTTSVCDTKSTIEHDFVSCNKEDTDVQEDIISRDCEPESSHTKDCETIATTKSDEMSMSTDRQLDSHIATACQTDGPISMSNPNTLQNNLPSSIPNSDECSAGVNVLEVPLSHDATTTTATTGLTKPTAEDLVISGQSSNRNETKTNTEEAQAVIGQGQGHGGDNNVTDNQPIKLDGIACPGCHGDGASGMSKGPHWPSQVDSAGLSYVIGLDSVKAIPDAERPPDITAVE